jgi:hypothetical protein
MADTNAPLPPLPAHIEETIRLISQLRAEHHQNATPVQRALAPALGQIQKTIAAAAIQSTYSIRLASRTHPPTRAIADAAIWVRADD